MRKFPAFLSALAALLLSVPAWAASNSSFILNFQSAPATSVACKIAYPAGQTSFSVPVAAGTVVASCAMQPSSWSGLLTLSGADGALFSLNGDNVVVGSAPITAARNYSITVSAAP